MKGLGSNFDQGMNDSWLLVKVHPDAADALAVKTLYLAKTVDCAHDLKEME